LSHPAVVGLCLRLPALLGRNLSRRWFPALIWRQSGRTPPEFRQDALFTAIQNCPVPLAGEAIAETVDIVLVVIRWEISRRCLPSGTIISAMLSSSFLAIS